MSSRYVVAEFNIARYIAPIVDPVLADFFAFRDEIDTLAEESPGFIWRLADVDDVDPSGGLYDASMAINLSVWEDNRIAAAVHVLQRTCRHVSPPCRLVLEAGRTLVRIVVD